MTLRNTLRELSSEGLIYSAQEIKQFIEKKLLGAAKSGHFSTIIYTAGFNRVAFKEVVSDLVDSEKLEATYFSEQNCYEIAWE